MGASTAGSSLDGLHVFSGLDLDRVAQREAPWSRDTYYSLRQSTAMHGARSPLPCYEPHFIGVVSDVANL
jgi:hypothetical protein